MIRPGAWQPLTHAPRRLLVECMTCHLSAVNESNGLHRDGWQETVRAYRCGACARGAAA